jgi:hypothetical protein
MQASANVQAREKETDSERPERRCRKPRWNEMAWKDSVTTLRRVGLKPYLAVAAGFDIINVAVGGQICSYKI